jgi:hypothetical protein
MIKSRRMRWAWHVAHMRQKRSAYRVLVGKLRLRDHLEGPDVDVRLILKWIFRKLNWRARTDLAQNMGMWWAFVAMVMNIQVPQNVRNFLTS